MPRRVILHADMDAFYASIEQRDDPALRGRPVVVGGLGRRGVVSTASYEAREFGVHSAMPTAEARRRCPAAAFVVPRMQVYAEASAQIRAVFEEITPLVEPLSLDEAFLDVTASRALFGDGRAIAERIRTQVFAATRLTISIGIAPNKFLAKVASDLEKPNGVVEVRAGHELEFLAPLPVARLWGAGKVLQRKLGDFGIHTIADVQACTLESLTERFGQATGAHLHELAHARDSRPVVAEREAKSISHECTFEHDETSPAACRAVLLDHAERVGRRLRQAGLRGRVVKLKLRFPPFETKNRQVTLESATDDDLRIYHAAVALFDAAHEGRPVRLLGVGVAALTDEVEPAQGQLFAARPAADTDPVLRAMDAIRDRFGEDSIGHGK